jgi:cytochrome c peroxidase
MVAGFGIMTETPYAERGVCDANTKHKERRCRSDLDCAGAGGQGKCVERGEPLPGDGGIDGNRMFKVPSLRNVIYTAPYFHDGSAQTLDQAIRTMGEVQLGKKLSETDIRTIKAFLASASSEKIK